MLQIFQHLNQALHTEGQLSLETNFLTNPTRQSAKGKRLACNVLLNAVFSGTPCARKREIEGKKWGKLKRKKKNPLNGMNVGRMWKSNIVLRRSDNDHISARRPPNPQACRQNGQILAMCPIVAFVWRNVDKLCFQRQTQ